MAKANVNYQKLSDELDEVLARLEDPSTPIDEALELNAKGQKLITELEAYLKDAKNKVQLIAKGKA